MVQYFIYMHIKVIWSDNRLPVEIIIRNKKKKRKKRERDLNHYFFLKLMNG